MGLNDGPYPASAAAVMLLYEYESALHVGHKFSFRLLSDGFFRSAQETRGSRLGPLATPALLSRLGTINAIHALHLALERMAEIRHNILCGPQKNQKNTILSSRVRSDGARRVKLVRCNCYIIPDISATLSIGRVNAIQIGA